MSKLIHNHIVYFTHKNYDQSLKLEERQQFIPIKKDATGDFLDYDQGLEIDERQQFIFIKDDAAKYSFRLRYDQSLERDERQQFIPKIKRMRPKILSIRERVTKVSKDD